MRLGILSDTHDHAAAMLAGLQILRGQGVDFILHCGDIGSEPCIDLLAGLPSAFVWGNTDWDRVTLGRYATEIGVTCHGNFGDLRFDDKRVALIHGDDYVAKRRILAAGEHDYLLQGHTHVRADAREGRTRMINPGALHRAPEKTVAVLDLATDALDFFRVDIPAHRP